MTRTSQLVFMNKKTLQEQCTNSHQLGHQVFFAFLIWQECTSLLRRPIEGPLRSSGLVWLLHQLSLVHILVSWSMHQPDKQTDCEGWTAIQNQDSVGIDPFKKHQVTVHSQSTWNSAEHLSSTCGVWVSIHCIYSLHSEMKAEPNSIKGSSNNEIFKNSMKPGWWSSNTECQPKLHFMNCCLNLYKLRQSLHWKH